MSVQFQSNYISLFDLTLGQWAENVGFLDNFSFFIYFTRASIHTSFGLWTIIQGRYRDAKLEVFANVKLLTNFIVCATVLLEPRMCDDFGNLKPEMVDLSSSASFSEV